MSDKESDSTIDSASTNKKTTNGTNANGNGNGNESASSKDKDLSRKRGRRPNDEANNS